MDSNQKGDRRVWWGGKGKGFSGTTIKDTWTKPRGVGIRGKSRKLYLNNNKI